MGYDLHITRKTEWSDDGPDITLEEWTRVVESDPSLRFVVSFSIDLPDGSKLTSTSKHLTVWSGHSSNHEVPFSFWDEQIVVKNPDTEIIEKMVALARELNATVQGDDGETYPLETPAASSLGSLTGTDVGHGRSPGGIASRVIWVLYIAIGSALVHWIIGK